MPPYPSPHLSLHTHPHMPPSSPLHLSSRLSPHTSAPPACRTPPRCCLRRWPTTSPTPSACRPEYCTLPLRLVDYDSVFLVLGVQLPRCFCCSLVRLRCPPSSRGASLVWLSGSPSALCAWFSVFVSLVAAPATDVAVGPLDVQLGLRVCSSAARFQLQSHRV